MLSDAAKKPDTYLELIDQNFAPLVTYDWEHVWNFICQTARTIPHLAEISVVSGLPITRLREVITDKEPSGYVRGLVADQRQVYTSLGFIHTNKPGKLVKFATERSILANVLEEGAAS